MTGDIVAKEGVTVAIQNGPSGGQPNGAQNANGDPAARGLDIAWGMSDMSGKGGGCNQYNCHMEQLIRTKGYSMAQFRSIAYDYRLGPKQWRAPIGQGQFEVPRRARLSTSPRLPSPRLASPHLSPCHT